MSVAEIFGRIAPSRTNQTENDGRRVKPSDLVVQALREAGISCYTNKGVDSLLKKEGLNYSETDLRKTNQVISVVTPEQVLALCEQRQKRGEGAPFANCLSLMQDGTLRYYGLGPLITVNEWGGDGSLTSIVLARGIYEIVGWDIVPTDRRSVDAAKLRIVAGPIKDGDIQLVVDTLMKIKGVINIGGGLVGCSSLVEMVGGNTILPYAIPETTSFNHNLY